MTRAVLSAAARRDLDQAITWIAKDNPAAARSFRAAVAAALTQIGEFPNSGVERLDLARPDYRFLSLTGFPHTVIYLAGRRPPLVARILHGARDLESLLSDLRKA